MRPHWFLIRIAFALWLFLSVEVASGIALAMLDRKRGLRYRPITTRITPHDADRVRRFAAGERYLMPSSALGWALRPGAVWGSYRATPQGLRGDRVYDSLPPPGVVRVAAFGDSFTHGDDVPNPETWTARLEGPGLEVLNFGVPGYGFDQAYLRYLADGRRFRPHVVLIGLYAEDVNRGLNVWRPFYLGHYDIPSAKPRFHLTDSLCLEPNPLADVRSYAALVARPDSVLPILGDRDYFYQIRERAGPLDRSAAVRLLKLSRRVVIEWRDGTLRHGVLRAGDPGPRLAIATLRRFVETVRQDRATPIVVLFPNQPLLVRYKRDGTRAVGVLAGSLPEVETVDLHPVLDVADFVHTGHYSAEGNRKVTETLRARLRQLGLVP